MDLKIVQMDIKIVQMDIKIVQMDKKTQSSSDLFIYSHNQKTVE